MAEVQQNTAEVKKAKEVAKDDKRTSETEGPQKLHTLMKTIPTAKKKFKKLRKRKKSLTSAELVLVDPRYSASKEGPFGLGPIVFPFLQRFNNIDCFMTLYVVAVIIHELCMEENINRNLDCDGNSIPDRLKFIYFHIIGQCILGIAEMPIVILGLTFICDHIPTSSSGFYLALGHSTYLMGYLLGVVAGTYNFQFPPKEKINGIGPANLYQLLQSRWWKCFSFIAVISFCLSLMMAGFPTSLPGAHKLRLAKRKEPPTIDRRFKDMEIQPHLSFFHAIWYILRNPLLLTQAIYLISESLTFNASLYFLPYHLQSQFLLTPKIASLLTGLFVLPGGVIGHFLGGVIVDRLEMTNKNKLKFSLVTTVVSVALFLLIFFVECETTAFAGINEDYDGFGRLGNLTAECNEYCDCTTSLYSPVCGRDEKEYFSPCFAGCKSTKVFQNAKTFYNCSCIREGLTTSDDNGHFIDAFDGKCNTNCLTLPLFFAFYFSATVFSNMGSIPAISIIIQSVPVNFSSLGMGVTYTMLKFTASVPEPFLFSLASTIACIYWDTNRCGVKGRCWIYDKKTLVLEFMGIWVTFELITVLLNIYAIQVYDFVVKGEITESKTKLVKVEKEIKERKA
ncbi:solute carrier organic anion transporter family member 6A1-like isoform X2 [Mastomys coucha]|uniref:solute carrier organic anion transporter family member 6A1-like isoform X2 n=1 Tax=Mastomys coucha TaxID=35658 RepID=UPI0012619D23|nr:solute carrier organic anion transporter family member 6A1-like isoform X2 [Mastomys coucha]